MNLGLRQFASFILTQLLKFSPYMFAFKFGYGMRLCSYARKAFDALRDFDLCVLTSI